MIQTISNLYQQQIEEIKHDIKHPDRKPINKAMLLIMDDLIGA